MIFLIGSIVLSSWLTLSFKICERYGISIFQAIVFNYFTCVITGSIVNGSFPFTHENLHSNWMIWALGMGALFVIIFNMIGFTAQKVGIAVASVANKSSLVIPFIFSIYLYKEKVNGWGITGILLALLGVVLTCYPAETNPSSELKTHKRWLLIFPSALFIGSGVLDTLIKYVQFNFLNTVTENPFLITSFATAFMIGSLILIVQLFLRGTRIQFKAILAGITIGVPNYFSIWCLVKFLKISPWQSSASIPVNNMGIVLFSSVMAWLIFKERLSKVNLTGILMSIIAIYLIAFENNI